MIDDVDDRFGISDLFFLRQDKKFTVAASDKDSLDPMIDQMIDEMFCRFIVDALFCITMKRRYDRCYDPFHFHITCLL